MLCELVCKTDESSSDEVNLNTSQKKRGRKPKANNSEKNVSIKKKRGRKPSGKIYEGNIEPLAISECIITHLALSEKDIEKITGEVKINKPNVQIIEKHQISFSIESDTDLKHMLNEKTSELENLKLKYNELEENYKKYSYLETIVTDNGVIDRKYHVPYESFIDISNNKWKDKTNIWCSWCVHPFESVPIGLPESYCYKTKKYLMRECFCSFNCAHAYNLSLNDHKVWERYSLMMKIKNDIYKNTHLIDKPINYAPPRNALTVFNGTKTINEFRCNSITIPTEYNILMPPIIPIFSIIEEIPKYFQYNKTNSIQDRLKIKRNKPLPIKKGNLLDLIK